MTAITPMLWLSRLRQASASSPRSGMPYRIDEKNPDGGNTSPPTAISPTGSASTAPASPSQAQLDAEYYRYNPK